MTIKNNLLQKNITKYLLAPGILLTLWFAATLVYSSHYNGSYTVVSHNHNKEIFYNHNTNRILKNEKIAGEFEARDKNLGIVAIRFQQQQRIPWKNEDILVFRIKEKGSEKWYYQNTYYSGLTYDVPNLPFGFPIIPDSQGKMYQFELVSTKGNSLNGLILSNKDPVFTSRYQMDKNELLGDSQKFLNFLFIKLLNTFDTPDILFSSVIYFLPFTFYLLWITGVLSPILNPILKLLHNSKIYRYLKSIYGKNLTSVVLFSLVLLISILYDIFVLQILNDAVYIVVFALWLIVQRIADESVIFTYITALSLLCFAAILNQSTIITMAEKAAAWAIVLLVAGTLIQVFRLRKINQ